MSKKWYVLHTYSGYENKVKKNLETRVESMGLENSVFAIDIPTEMVTEIKEGGRRVENEKKVFPGYVLVRMELDDR
ncbi:MAG: transcription termination/antitermination protein NusG, partial [Coriobacteriaceae bacterium]|nr:transcription termination/antitermination protein NusG [Coriobacteriaceae bacterium]